MRSWTPLEGPYHGFLITHSEAISIADYLTITERGTTQYRPTVHYAYHPCDGAVLSLHELAGKNWHVQERKRLLMAEITGGIDELGVLLMGHERGAYWFGSRLSIAEARKLAPYNNATSVQVTAWRCWPGWCGRSTIRANGDRRARRDGFPPHSRDLHALPRSRGR